MGVLSTLGIDLGWRSDGTFTDVSIGGDVPAGAQRALLFFRHDNSNISSITTTFGSVSVISAVTAPGPRCAIAVVAVDDSGSGHTLSVTYTSSGNGARIIGVVFLDELDISAQANWLRDFDTAQSNSITVDSDATDLVLMAHGCWGSGPPSEPTDTTTVIAPFSHDNNDQRVVSVDAPGASTTTTTSSGENPSAAGASVFFTAGTTQVSADSELRWSILAAIAADSDLRWSVLQSLQNDLTAQWDIRAGVNADLDARWNILQAINADSDLQWSVLQQIAQDLELRWNTDSSLSTVQSDLTLQWSIIAAIAQSLQLDWSILQSVTQDADIRWSVLASATQDLTARWDVLQAIESGATLQWDVIGTAERTLTLRWSIESDSQFPDITGEITIQTATPRITIASATPRITIH